MKLEEAEKQFTPERRTASNPVGENEIVVRSPHEKEYHIYVGKPRWEPGQEISSWPKVGLCSDLEEVKQFIAELPFASEIDSNGWDVDPENK